MGHSRFSFGEARDEMLAAEEKRIRTKLDNLRKHYQEHREELLIQLASVRSTISGVPVSSGDLDLAYRIQAKLTQK